MAKKRMFSQDVISNDNFLEMPDSSQNLYFHLSMQADDDGFISNYKSLMRMLGKKEDDLKVLIAKQFIIHFKNGILVIKHWKLNNTIRNDRYIETIYKEEKAQLTLDESKVYQMDTNGIPLVCIDKIRLDKIRLDKISNKDKDKKNIIKKEYGEFKNVLLTNEELEKLKKGFNDYETKIETLSCYIESTGKKYKSHYATILNWSRKDEKPKVQNFRKININDKGDVVYE